MGALLCFLCDMCIFCAKGDHVFLLIFTAMKQVKLVLDRRFSDYYIAGIPK